MCKKIIKDVKVEIKKPDGTTETFITDMTLQYKSSEKIPYPVKVVGLNA